MGVNALGHDPSADLIEGLFCPRSILIAVEYCVGTHAISQGDQGEGAESDVFTGGIDPFLMKAKDGSLSVKALRLKRLIAKKTASA